MSRRASRSGAAIFAALAVLLSAAGTATAATWELFPLPVPPGGQVSTPPGEPGDLAFFAPNRGVMTVTGNTSVPRGVYSWDGREWHQLATVCGATGLDSPIAWAGPTEFWTITNPSPGVEARGALCRFKDGAVEGSYAGTNVDGYDYSLDAAACRAADDCWFGGAGAESLDGTQAGAFHLRWNGSALTPVYAPQGRMVTDLQTHAGRMIESVGVGTGSTALLTPVLRFPEPVPALLHWIDGATFSNDPWTPAPLPGLPDDITRMSTLDSDGTTAWAAGGYDNTGPSAGRGLQRPPIVARLDGGVWTELTLTGDPLLEHESIGDIAAVPGTQTAWATLVGDAVLQPRIAFIAADGTVTVHDLAGVADPLRGAAAHLACPAADDCWLATTRGYLFRWGGPKDYAVDTDPAFQGTITERPNEGAAQFVPDTPPTDDSRLFAPPVEVPLEPPGPAPTCATPPRLLSGVRRPRRTLVRGQSRRARDPRYELEVRFRLARRAHVALVAERRSRAEGRRVGGAGTRPRRSTRVVARTRMRTLRAGRRALTVVVRPSAWPTRLRFVTREASRPRCVPEDLGLAETAATR